MRTNLRLFLLLLLVLMAVVGVGVGYEHNRANDSQGRELRLKALESGWQQALAARTLAAELRLQALLRDPEILAAIDRRDTAALARLVPQRLAPFGEDGAPRFELATPEGQPLLPGAQVLDGRLAALLGSTAGLRGIRQASGTGPLAVAVLRLERSGRPLALALVALDLVTTVETLAAGIGAPTALLDATGVLRVSSGVAPWNDIVGGLDDAPRRVRDLFLPPQYLAVASLPVPDMAGGRAGTLLVVDDLTAARRERRLWIGTGLALLLVLAGIVLASVHLALRRAAAPVHAAAAVLEDVAKGERGMELVLPPGDPVTERLAAAVDRLR